MDASESDPDGESLLQAAMTGDREIVTSLLAPKSPRSTFLANYASPINRSSMTALIWASAEGYSNLVLELLDAGAAVDAKSSTGMTALAYALANLPLIKPKVLPDPGFPNQQDLFRRLRPDPATAAKQVAYRNYDGGSDGDRNYLGCVKLLLARGASVEEARNDFGETMLHVAAGKGYQSLVELITPGLVDVESVDSRYVQTALHVAAKEDRHEIVRYLVEVAGAKVDPKNVVGWTPLMWAVASGNVETVRVLVELGADVNAEGQTGKAGETSRPLGEARRCREPEQISRILIRAGAIE